jgi:hypothetical protein
MWEHSTGSIRTVDVESSATSYCEEGLAYDTVAGFEISCETSCMTGRRVIQLRHGTTVYFAEKL